MNNGGQLPSGGGGHSGKGNARTRCRDAYGHRAVDDFNGLHEPRVPSRCEELVAVILLGFADVGEPGRSRRGSLLQFKDHARRIVPDGKTVTCLVRQGGA